MLNVNRTIILGSGSPRRKELLELIGLKFQVIKSDKEEVVNPELSTEEVVKSLALQKAEDIISKVPDDGIIITADTLVACEGKILGKPVDEKDAFMMLKLLSGRRQSIFTGVIIWDKKYNKRYEMVEESYLYMRELEDQEIMEYIRTGDAMDKAGAYGAQTQSAVFIDRVEGDFFNIVGLPIKRVYEVLREIETEDKQG